MLQNAYVLRFWRATQRDVWRVTLIAIHEETTEQHFGSLEDMYRHLQENYAQAEIDPRSHTQKHEGRTT